MKKEILMVESSLEHITKLKHLKSDAEMLFFHCFSKQNVISSQNVSIFINKMTPAKDPKQKKYQKIKK